jgi:hypothetical protein
MLARMLRCACTRQSGQDLLFRRNKRLIQTIKAEADGDDGFVAPGTVSYFEITMALVNRL